VRIARRRLLKAAVFRTADVRPADARPADVRPADARAADARASSTAGARAGATQGAAGLLPDRARARFATSGELPRAVTGEIIDVSPHFLVLSNGASQQRFALTPDATRLAGRRA
jgi:hypothetical protein